MSVMACYEAFMKEQPDGSVASDQSAFQLNREAHTKFLKKALKTLPAKYSCLDSSRPWFVFWILRALELLGTLDRMEVTDEVCSFLSACQSSKGGFAGGPGQLPHLACTYAAVAALSIVGTEEAYRVINRPALYRFLISMKDRSTGGFRVHENGETDMRGCYCAIAVASMMKMLTPELETGGAANATLCAGVLEYIHKCQTWEGGIAGEPGLEAHGGYAFCGLAAATMLGKAKETLNLETMSRWVCQRQFAFEGGFNGRPNKLVDSCYSYWQYGSLSILRTLLGIPQEEKAWCAPEPLQMYVLLACQDWDKGGFKDKPGKNCDYYHTCYAMSGVAASQWHRGSPPSSLGGEDTVLTESDVLYNISKEARNRLEKYFDAVPALTHEECFGSSGSC
ncbi:hypothetical protein FOL47_004163 [Perkinsus chesapeaki]|uniref:Protein farnesyltransferase subunit beta n=1 Tax=Perkinsus chesapeaki TaxID=330153 RepID=A0A7J6M5C9_PERCH|nr:hypothetical protein FOL47_004163 [Perkinsus chesapeaki]